MKKPLPEYTVFRFGLTTENRSAYRTNHSYLPDWERRQERIGLGIFINHFFVAISNQKMQCFTKSGQPENIYGDGHLRDNGKGVLK
jgi:hypothetical protein